MKVAIFFTALIVGSSGGLLGPVTNALDAITASVRANSLLSSLQSQIALNAVAATANITVDVQELVAAFQSASETLQNIFLQSELDVSEAATEITQAFADITSSVSSVDPQINAAISSLQTQITSLVSPQIQKLITNISNGVLKLKCFIDKVPQIEGNITEAVFIVTDFLVGYSAKLHGLVDDTKVSVEALVQKTIGCDRAFHCLITLVSLSFVKNLLVCTNFIFCLAASGCSAFMRKRQNWNYRHYI